MAGIEQEMVNQAESIQTVEELREACAEFGVEMTPKAEEAFMAMKASGASFPTRSRTRPSEEEGSPVPTRAT